MILCSVAIPVFNRRDLVRKALESALSQNVPGLEILVVDNCSTDGTWEVLKTYQDPRLRLIRNDENVGLFGNFNKCLALANGSYLRFLCSDDVLVPGCLENEIRIMNKHPEVVLLTTAGQFVDAEGRALGNVADDMSPGVYTGPGAIWAWFTFFSSYGRNPFNYPSGVLFRREIACRVGEFDTSMRLAGDVNFYLKVLEHGELAVTGALGCKILVHEQQEQVAANLSGAGMREHLTNLERHRALLQRQGSYSRIRRRLSGVILGVAYFYLRTGKRPAAKAHIRVLQDMNVGWASAVLAFIRFWVRRRLFMMTFGRKPRSVPDRLL